MKTENKHSVNIEKVSIDSIVPYWRNPRKNEEAVTDVTESISKYGYNVPIIVDKEGVIIAGHTRYKALMRLEVKEVGVVRLDLPEEKARRFRIADNKVGEFSYWDDEILQEELKDIVTEDPLSMSAFFSQGEWQDILDSAGIEVSLDDGEGELADPYSEPYRGEAESKHIETICPHCLEVNIFAKESLLDLGEDIEELNEQ
tara:strand:+ start:7437 stop:8039 length:603 start_codon:yes stop_codon:yes gene_type:complete